MALRGLIAAMARLRLGDAPQVDHDHAGKTTFYSEKADIFLVYDLLISSPENLNKKLVFIEEFTVHFMSVGPLKSKLSG